MSPAVTRRGFAKAGVVALGATVVGLPVSAQEPTPDAELFQLLDSYPAAVAVMQLAGDRCEALWQTLSAEEPDRPGALHLRHDDGFGFDHECDIYQLRDGRQARIYGLDEIEKLRARPQPTRVEESREPLPGHPGNIILRSSRLPDERRIARRAEIIAAFDVWWAAYQSVKDRLGIPAAEDADDEATGVVWDLEAAILASVPMTLAGLAAKARWAAQCRRESTFAADWHKRIVEDVIALVGHAGASS